MTGAEIYLLSAVGGMIYQGFAEASAKRERERLYGEAEQQYETLLPTLVQGAESRLGTMYRGLEERQQGAYAARGLGRSGAAASAERRLGTEEARTRLEAEADIRARIAKNLADIKMGRASMIGPTTFGSEIAGLGATMLAGGSEYGSLFGTPRQAAAGVTDGESPSYEEIIRRRAEKGGGE